MTASSVVRLVVLSMIASASLACSGPPVPSAIDGEPVCPDFEIGAAHAKMRGSLRYPVRVSIAEGKSAIMKTTIVGLRSPQDPPTRILLPDANGEFTVEWAQCENERAPRPVEISKDPKKEARHEKEAKEASSYECGNANVYKTETVTTKKGDLSTHAVHFAPPAKLECWQSEEPLVAPAAADAGAPSANAPAAVVTDAGGDDAAAPVPAPAPTPRATPASESKDGGAKQP